MQFRISYFVKYETVRNRSLFCRVPIILRNSFCMLFSKIQKRKLSTLVPRRYRGGRLLTPPHTGQHSQLGLTVSYFILWELRNCGKQVTVLPSSDHFVKLVGIGRGGSYLSWHLVHGPRGGLLASHKPGGGGGAGRMQCSWRLISKARLWYCFNTKENSTTVKAGHWGLGDKSPSNKQLL